MTYPTKLRKGDRLLIPRGLSSTRVRWTWVEWDGLRLRRQDATSGYTPAEIKRFVANQLPHCPRHNCAGCMQVVIFEALIAEGAL